MFCICTHNSPGKFQCGVICIWALLQPDKPTHFSRIAYMRVCSVRIVCECATDSDFQSMPWEYMKQNANSFWSASQFHYHFLLFNNIIWNKVKNNNNNAWRWSDEKNSNNKTTWKMSKRKRRNYAQTQTHTRARRSARSVVGCVASRESTRIVDIQGREWTIHLLKVMSIDRTWRIEFFTCNNVHTHSHTHCDAKHFFVTHPMAFICTV